jgi:ABC-type polysaccharide/polyol phosphate transport system ATPase subunit
MLGSKRLERDLLMFSDVIIRVENLSKRYEIYETPRDRLKQFVLPRLRKVAGLSSKEYFREFWALKNVSFEIKRGETVGIVGRNGSGKSTLLQIICGTLTPTAGSVVTNGRISALLELGSGFNPEFSGRENVFLNGAIHGLSRESIENKIDRIAAFADIGDFFDQPVKTYSSGMYARLAFSASMFVDPDILIVDEILAVGDAPFQSKCMRAFHKLRDEGCSIIIVSHDSYMIKNFCQRALYLRKGDFVGFGKSECIVDQYNIEVENALAQRLVLATTNNDTSISMGVEEIGLSLFKISLVELLDSDERPTSTVRAGEKMTLSFQYTTLTQHPPKVTFVVNLYRHDGLYICGITTLMDSYPPFSISHSGKVRVTFPVVRLLAGQYIWRVAINDERAFGVFAEANQVCGFNVIDQLEAVGLFNLERVWSITADKE